MHLLHIGPGWALQVAAIRDAQTESTNLIRVGNTFYRLCREDVHRFEVLLSAGAAALLPPLRLTLESRGLHVVDVDGRAPGGMPGIRPPAGGDGLRRAVQRLAAGTARPDEAPALRALVAFGVAESIRSDHLAGALERSFEAPGMPGPGGDPTLLQWWTLAQQWGPTSEAIFATLSPAAREIVGQPPSRLTPQQRHYSEYVDVTRLPAPLRQCAQTTKVLQRPRQAPVGPG
jgi:hypothetical protein